MLQNIRKNSQGGIAKVIVFLIVASFATFGVQSILVGSGNVDVAEIDGLTVSAQELQQAITIQKRRLLTIFGENIDASLLDDQLLRGPAMDSLIQKKVYLSEAANIGVGVGDEAVKLGIMEMPQFGENGIFSPVLYQNLLSTNGYSAALFQTLLKEEQVIRQLRSGIANTEFLTELELNQTAVVSQEERDVRYLSIDIDSFKNELTPDLSEIESFYQANLARFMTQESVKIEYIEIQTKDFYQEINEKTILDEYKLRVANYEGGEERRVSHILIEDGSVDSQERIAIIRSKAESGENFAILANTFSDDKSSAQSGGDLGFTDGNIFPEEIEEAIKTLELNVISDPVKTSDGLHFLQVTEIQEKYIPQFDDLRAELEEEIQLRTARKEIVNTVETLKDLVFNAEGLSEPANELGLTIDTVENIRRSGNDNLFVNTSLINASFSDEVLIQGHNSEVIELNDDHFVVLRVDSHSKSIPKPVSLVSAQIETELTKVRAIAATEARALEILIELRAGGSIEAQALANGYEWQVELGMFRESKALAPEVVNRVFALQMPLNNTSLYDYVAMADGNIVVFELARITKGSIGDMSAVGVKQLAGKINQELSRSIDRHYRQALRDRAEVQVL